MDLDSDLLASIASGGLGHWYDDDAGGQTYVKDDDCIRKLNKIVIKFKIPIIIKWLLTPFPIPLLLFSLLERFARLL